MIRKAINHPKEEFIVWGDGSQTRNLLYVDDCVEALLKLETKASVPPTAVNVGSERTTTVRELAMMIIKLSKKQIDPIFDRGAPMGPISRAPDVGKAKSLLNWLPKVSLEEGLVQTYNFALGLAKSKNWPSRSISSCYKR